MASYQRSGSMRRPLGRVALAAAAVGLICGASGCKSKKDNHREWVNAAEMRYNHLRSGIMLPMAIQQLEAGDLDQAQRTVREALSLDGTNPRLYVVAGRIAFERGHLERAYHLLNTAIEHGPELAEAYYFQGIVFQRWQQFDRARESYGLAFEHEKDNPAYLLAQAEMMVELDQTAEAIALLKEKVDYFDQNAGLRGALGHLHFMNRQHREAVVYFREATMLDPDNVKFQEEYALSLIGAGDHRRAAQVLESLRSQSALAGRSDLARALAACYEQEGNLRDAARVYVGLTRSGGAQVEDWIKLGEYQWKLDDPGQTLHCANRVIHLAPDRHEGYLMAGMVWQKRGRLEDALRMFSRAADHAPNSSAPLILRGISLQQAGRQAAAREAYAEALRRQPDDPRALRLLQALVETAP